MWEIRRAARRQTFAECWLVNGHSVDVVAAVEGRSGVVVEVGVVYSDEE